MTAQSTSANRRRRRRKTARGRLPFDLIALILIVAGVYFTTRFWPPRSQPIPAAPPAAHEAAPLPVLPPMPALEPVSEPSPARRPARRAPQHVVPDASEAAPHDPFAGLQPLSAQELDDISQAR